MFAVRAACNCPKLTVYYFLNPGVISGQKVDLACLVVFFFGVSRHVVLLQDVRLTDDSVEVLVYLIDEEGEELLRIMLLVAIELSHQILHVG